MAITRADWAAFGTEAGNAVSATLPLAVGAGDLLVAWGHCNNSNPPASPFSDIVNGTWTSSVILVSGITNSSGRLYLGWVLSSAAASANTLAVVCEGSSTSDRTYLTVVRYHSSTAGTWSKVAHKGATDGGSTGTAADSGLTSVAAAAGDLLVGACIDGGVSGNETFTAGNDGAANSYTASVNQGWLFDEYILSATAGTKKATMTMSQAAGWGAGVGIFRINATDTQAPTVPSGLSALVVSSRQVNLSWSAASDNVGVTGYTVYRGGVSIGTTAATTYSDTSVAPSSGYSYTVDAFDAAGNHSAQSSAASATTPAAPPAAGWPRLARVTIPYS